MTDAEINTAVAAQVMSWKRDTTFKRFYIPEHRTDDTAKLDEIVPMDDFRPSTSIADAWRVIERMEQRGFKWAIGNFDKHGFRVMFGDGKSCGGKEFSDPCRPRAICLAALHALNANGGPPG